MGELYLASVAPYSGEVCSAADIPAVTAVIGVVEAAAVAVSAASVVDPLVEAVLAVAGKFFSKKKQDLLCAR